MGVGTNTETWSRITILIPFSSRTRPIRPAIVWYLNRYTSMVGSICSTVLIHCLISLHNTEVLPFLVVVYFLGISYRRSVIKCPSGLWPKASVLGGIGDIPSYKKDEEEEEKKEKEENYFLLRYKPHHAKHFHQYKISTPWWNRKACN